MARRVLPPTSTHDNARQERGNHLRAQRRPRGEVEAFIEVSAG